MEKNEATEKKKLRILAKEKIKKLQGDSKWTLPQQILQEIIVTFKVEEKKVPNMTRLRELLIKEIEIRYKDDEGTKQAILDAIPNRYAMSLWIKKPDWKEAVWDVVKTEGLFSSNRRSKVINALYEKATSEKADVNAAKVFLTMSGDYSDKLDVKQDATVEKYREIAEVLQKKKTSISD